MVTINQLYQIPEFKNYYDLILEWNSKFNLTAITNADEVYLKHFLDSLLPLEYFSNKETVLDIGSGAGLPAIPLKLFLPSTDFTLTDSVNKKITFLDVVISSLKLDKIRAIHTRIEDFLMRDFDVVTARAVAPMNVLSEYALPFVKVGGIFVAYKGPDTQLEESKNAINLLGGEVEKVITYDLEGNTRNIIIIKKVCPSPKIYPRKQNKPRTQPLI